MQALCTNDLYNIDQLQPISINVFFNFFRKLGCFIGVQGFYPDIQNIHVYIPIKVCYSCKYKDIWQPNDKDYMIAVLRNLG